MKIGRLEMWLILAIFIQFATSKSQVDHLNSKTDKFFKMKYKSEKGRKLVILKKKYKPMYDNAKLERELIPGDPSSEEGNEIGVLLGDTMGGVMSLSLADTPKVVMVDQAPFYSYI